MGGELGAAKKLKFSGRRILGIASIAIGVVVLACVVVFLSFPDAFVQRFVEERVTRRLAAAYPGYSIRISGMHFNIVENRLACDTVMLRQNDSSFSCSVASLSVSGIHWLGLLRGGSSDPGNFAGTVLEAGRIDMAFQPSGYGLRCGPLRVSVPDSEIVAESLEMHPLENDEQFFAGSRFRKTRFGIAAHQCRLQGVPFAGVLRGENIRARSLRCQDVSADVLINKDKPSVENARRPRMPSEILSSMKDTVGLDSLIITGCRLKYSERFVRGRNPATLTFDRVQVLVTGVASHAGADAEADIQARGTFMGGGTITMAMSIPLSGPQFSFGYSGSLSGMDLSRLNPWIGPSDQTRIKSGMLGSASFDIAVNAGSATGHVHAVYRDLVVASISARTGSENGLVERFSSWVAKNVKIRGTNTPDKAGAMKVGTVKYSRKKDDPFFGFTWFALRSGVGDVVGF
jgi:hypothetical protein